MLDANRLVETHNILFMTLDTLRFDVADAALQAEEIPTLAQFVPNGRWERRHTPGNFTYAAHQAFFAGFLPTPSSPGPHSRLFAARFPGSETTDSKTCVFETADIVSGLSQRGFHTICIGGVGFFNKQSELGRVLPSLFDESHWEESFGVSSKDSTRNQVAKAIDSLQKQPATRQQFLFLNVSALHQPNCFYLAGATSDSPASQRAALKYVDSQLEPLLAEISRNRSALCIVCSDHGTAYGENGYTGHRLNHRVVGDVPYCEFLIQKGQLL